MISDFQLKIIDILTTPEEEYRRSTENVDEESFDLLEFLEQEVDN